MKKYIHEELNQEVRSIAGYYLLEKEERLIYNGREIFYVLVCGVIDNSCCGVGGCRYASVPGYVVEWKNKTDEAGRAVSQVETITDDGSKAEIFGIIQKKETVDQVEFL